MHFVMSAFSNHVDVLDNVTPIDLPAQSVVLSDGVVFCITIIFTLTSTALSHQIYENGRGGSFPSCGGVAGLCIL